MTKISLAALIPFLTLAIEKCERTEVDLPLAGGFYMAFPYGESPACSARGYTVQAVTVGTQDSVCLPHSLQGAFVAPVKRLTKCGPGGCATSNADPEAWPTACFAPVAVVPASDTERCWKPLPPAPTAARTHYIVIVPPKPGAARATDAGALPRVFELETATTLKVRSDLMHQRFVVASFGEPVTRGAKDGEACDSSNCGVFPLQPGPGDGDGDGDSEGFTIRPADPETPVSGWSPTY